MSYCYNENQTKKLIFAHCRQDKEFWVPLIEKAYDKSKDGFFDHLKSMTKPEAKKESNNYNKKNKDTFNLSENDFKFEQFSNI